MLRILGLLLFCVCVCQAAGEVTLKAPIAGAEDHVVILREADGSHRIVLKCLGERNDLLLTPEAFVSMYYQQQQRRGPIQWLFNISSPAGIAWVALGLAGQAAFAGRMVFQWIVSERRGRSVVPEAFWWMSLIGASMLLAYFLWRRDIVGILGQSIGWVIYVRNLVLLRRSAKGSCAVQPV